MKPSFAFALLLAGFTLVEPSLAKTAVPKVSRQALQPFLDKMCTAYREAIVRETTKPIYRAAVKRKAEGRQLPMSKYRLETIESWRKMMRTARCRNVP